MCLYLWVIAQIVLESFPISSSGHTQLLAYFCPPPLLPEQVMKVFDYVLHMPSACVILFFFRRTWFFPFMHIKRCWRLILKISAYAVLAMIITLFGYGLKVLMSFSAIPLPFGFFITGCSLLSLLVCPEGKYEKLDVKKVVCLGALQACALVPGISRFAVTFVGARWLRIPARRAFEISFLIQWPLIVCASLYGVYVLRVDAPELLNPMLMWVMLGSSGIAYAGLYMQENMIQKKSMWWWGIYMLVPFIISILVGVFYA